MERIKKNISGQQMQALDVLIETVIDEFLVMLQEDKKLKRRVAKVILDKANINKGIFGG